MSLAFCLCLLLSFGIIPLSVAGPQSLPYLSPYLSELIPICAQDCLENFIAGSFPTSTCPDQQDLACLCTSESESGFTIGEGALQCVASECINPQISEFAASYDICAGIPNSVPMTHGTLTATMATPSPILVSYGNTISTTEGSGSSLSASWWSFSSTTSISSPDSPSTPLSSMPTGLLTATGSPSIVTTDMPISFTGWVPSPPASTSISNTPTTLSLGSTLTAAAASSLTTPQPMLTTAQIAGVAVAGSATAAVAFGLLFFLFCVKKKQENKRNSGYSFGNDQPVVEILHELSSGDEVVAAGPDRSGLQHNTAQTKALRFLGVPTTSKDKAWGHTRQGSESEDIGVAIAPENITHEVSPISVASYRTTSRLLPEKPNYSLLPSPFQQKPPPRPERPAMLFIDNPELRVVPPEKTAGQVWQPMERNEAAIQPSYNPGRKPPSDPFTNNSDDPRAMMYAMERRRASRAQLPRIITPNSQPVQQASRTVQPTRWNPQPAPSYLPPPRRDIMKAAMPLPPVQRTTSQLKPISEVVSPIVYPGSFSHTAFDPYAGSQSQLSKYGPYRSKSGGRRPLTHYTSGSDTSFEDDWDEDDEVPPLPIGLSPVQESQSPTRTPLSLVRYPNIPPSSTPKHLSSPQSPTHKPQSRLQPQTVPVRAPIPRDFRGSAPLLGPPKSLDKNKQLPHRPFSPQGPVELEAGPDPRTNPNSAKYKILCSPGLEGLENVVSPRTIRTPRTVRSNERKLTTEAGSPRTWG